MANRIYGCGQNRGNTSSKFSVVLRVGRFPPAFSVPTNRHAARS